MNSAEYPKVEMESFEYPTLAHVPPDNIEVRAELLLEASRNLIIVLQAREQVLNPDIGIELIVGSTKVGLSNHKAVIKELEAEAIEIIKFIRGKPNTWA